MADAVEQRVRGAGAGDGDDGRDGQSDAGDEVAEGRRYDAGARLHAQQRSDDEVARPEEHREEGDPHREGPTWSQGTVRDLFAR